MLNITESEIHSVTEITRMVADQLSDLGVLWVEAEIVQLSIASSQHWYFDVKDPEDNQHPQGGRRSASRRGRSAVLSCTMFKNAQRSMSSSFRPKVGDRVRLRAKPGVYLGRLQLNVTRMLPAGAGERALRLAALKEKLR